MSKDKAMDKSERAGSDRDALEAKGKSRLDKLNKAWRKASDADRAAFLATLPAEALTRSLRKPTSPRAIANGRYLLPEGARRIEAALIRRRMTPKMAMAEMGFGPDDGALTRALATESSLRLAVIAALARWLDQQEEL